jgi:hypothetical protein
MTSSRGRLSACGPCCATLPLRALISIGSPTTLPTSLRCPLLPTASSQFVQNWSQTFTHGVNTQLNGGARVLPDHTEQHVPLSLQAWEVHRLLTEGIASGEVVPLPLNKFSRQEAGNAFRFMAAGQLVSLFPHSLMCNSTKTRHMSLTGIV